jgi:hypothetical protein
VQFVAVLPGDLFKFDFRHRYVCVRLETDRWGQACLPGDEPATGKPEVALVAGGPTRPEISGIEQAREVLPERRGGLVQLNVHTRSCVEVAPTVSTGVACEGSFSEA